MTMWSKLIYRIKRKKTNKAFTYFSYVTIFIPVLSAFMDGIGWLVPSVPIIRIIGERGFSYATPAVIIVQACLIFYYAITFFQSLKGVAVSQTTRTALVKITVLNLAMISFFILMFLSRIVSLLGLNMKSRAAQTGTKSPTGEDRPSMHFNRHLSNHASKGFTISDPNSLSSAQSSNIIPGPRLTHGYSQSQLQLLDSGRESPEYVVPDPYKFNEFGHHSTSPQFSHSYTSPNLTNGADHATMGGLSPRLGGATPAARGMQSVSPSPASLRDEMGYGKSNDEDNDSVYGSHRMMHSNGGQKYNGGNGGRVVGGLGRNSEGYARFDISDEDRSARAV
ncbi:hypothetical protein BGZ91_011981 [Linnemannia elongata]|nr:hypothetical protein BGZ91_011981 [Linnemannia elongata]